MINVPSVVLFAFLVHSMVGLALFASQSDVGAGEGSVARQVALILMCLALAPFVAQRWRQIRALGAKEVPLLLIALWSGISLSWALAPEVATRRWMLVLIVAYLSIGLCALINDSRRIHLVALAATGAVMVANYVTVFALPHVGLSSDARGTYWIGLQPHKNSAGMVSTLAFIVWLFAWRRFSPSWLMLGGAALWLFFQLQTGSRTSQFALVVTLACTFLLSLDNRHLRRSAIFIVLSICILALLSIMIGLLPAESAVALLFGDATFTGRTALWSFLVSQIHERPLGGVGIGSFWGVNDTSLFRTAQDDWFSATVQGHNGYLDITVTLGVIGLALCLALLFSPLRSLLGDEARIDAGRRVFCAIWVFGLIHNFGESTILRGDSVMWVLLLISIVILRSGTRRPAESSMRSILLRSSLVAGLRAAQARAHRTTA
jgi:O-antigen ligase